MPEDIFEKLFGKKPEEGYGFYSVKVIVASRGIVIQWGAKGVGFGEFCMFFEDGKILADTEHMGKEFCDHLIMAALDKIEQEHPMAGLTDDWGYNTSEINYQFVKSMYDNITWDETDV